MNEKEFWVVWHPVSGPPTVRHPSRESATEEAERLAYKYPGKGFYVLRAESVSLIESPPAITRRLAPVDLPF